MDPAITIPGHRRQNEIIRGRIQRYRLVILFCMTTRPSRADRFGVSREWRLDTHRRRLLVTIFALVSAVAWILRDTRQRLPAAQDYQ